jgi:hypothetical protein
VLLRRAGTEAASNPWVVAVVGVALTASVVLRLAPVLAPFPLEDGGLFWMMANELRDNGFVPPMTTAYNAADIPWMYPPLGLALVAVLGGGLAWFQVLPAAFAILTLPAMWLLGRALVGDRAALFATAAFGLAPAAFGEVLAGGGVARGPGMVFALLTMWAVARERPIPAGALAGLTLLTHPLAALYAGLGSAALWATRSRELSMLVAPALALGIGLLWFGPMAARHGIEPLLSGLASRGDPDIGNAAILLARLALYPPTVAVAAGLVGAAIAFRARRWDLLVWLGVTALGVGASGRWTIVPLSVLAGLAVAYAVEQWPRPRSVAILAVAAATALTGAISPGIGAPLTTSERATMAWAHGNSGPADTFAVIGYPADGGVVEWFPAIAQRRSVTTAQGSEWLPAGDSWERAWEDVRCRAISCLPEADFYVFQPGCCTDVERHMREVGPRVFVIDASERRSE